MRRAFIHRAGRTGRAGERGVASTLFASDQHSDLLQLERTLGLRMERMREGGESWDKPVRNASPASGSPRLAASASTRMQKLPGEVLQVQMEG